MDSKIIPITETIESYKCSLCNNFLSIPPIMIISKDGDQQKCGRCKDVASEMEVRNKLYEDIVKICSFPCIYPKCTQRIQWGDVDKHEKECPNRTIICPLLCCQSVVEISEYKFHCLTHHKNNLYFKKLVCNESRFFSIFVKILIKDELPFIIYIFTDSNCFSVSVLSLYPLLAENWKYSINLWSNETGPSLLFKKQNVIGLDERNHCIRCFLSYCELKHHPYSKLYPTKFKNIKTTVIDYKKIFNLFNMESFSWSITLIEDGKSEQSKTDKLSQDLCLNANAKLLQRIAQCPICMEYMVAPIYTCVTGHIICNTCKSKVGKCPTCKAVISKTRVFSLEELSNDIKISCRNLGNGCNFLGNVEKVRKHEAICSFAH